jgi:hypothetical protein
MSAIVVDKGKEQGVCLPFRGGVLVSIGIEHPALRINEPR